MTSTCCPLHTAVVDAETRHDRRDDPWANSPYRWVRSRSSRARGKAGEQIVDEWLTGRGYRVTSPTSSQHDRTVGNVKLEVKLSTLWTSGTFRFQQLRDQDYDAVALLGIAPHQLWLWVAAKDTVWQHAVGQHAGAAAIDTRWLEIDPDNVPGWLAACGGNHTEAAAAAVRLLGPPPGQQT